MRFEVCEVWSRLNIGVDRRRLEIDGYKRVPKSSKVDLICRTVWVVGFGHLWMPKTHQEMRTALGRL